MHFVLTPQPAGPTSQSSNLLNLSSPNGSTSSSSRESSKGESRTSETTAHSNTSISGNYSYSMIIYCSISCFISIIAASLLGKNYQCDNKKRLECLGTIMLKFSLYGWYGILMMGVVWRYTMSVDSSLHCMIEVGKGLAHLRIVWLYVPLLPQHCVWALQCRDKKNFFPLQC